MLNLFRVVCLAAVSVAYIVACSGCADPLRHVVNEKRVSQTSEYTVIDGLDVPNTKDENACGAQALATVVAYYDNSRDSQVVFEAIPFRAANAIHILLAARSMGYDAKVARGTWDLLEKKTREDVPTLVMFDRALEVWQPVTDVEIPKRPHWGVVSGVATDGKSVLLAAPNGKHSVVDRELFLKRWERCDFCAVTVRPHDEVSQTDSARVP